MMKWNDVVLNQFGTPVKSATVTVRNAGAQTNPPIYTVNSTASAVPSSQIVADAYGRYSFYAADGRYDLDISGSGITGYTESDISFFDPNASTGSAYVSFVQSGTGAVSRSVQDKLREWVSGKDFNVANNGVTDDWAAIQKALNTGSDVRLIDTTGLGFAITAPLSVGTQRFIGQGSTGGFNQAILLPSGNTKAIINKAGVFSSFEIDGFFIDYGDIAPSVALGNDSKYGFYFSGASFPQYARVANCTVRGGWGGLYDDAGVYESICERVRTVKCRTGFTKTNGTTATFLNCGSGGSGAQQGFVISSVLVPVLVNCASDQLAVTSATPNLSGNYFSNCPGLQILGFDAESNTITGADVSLFKFDLCVGSIKGFAGLANTLSGTAGQAVRLFSATNNSRLNVDGCRVAATASTDLIFSGAGDPYTLYVDGTSICTLLSSAMNAAINGTPGTRYSVYAQAGGEILNIKSFVDNTTNNSYATTSAISGSVCQQTSYRTSINAAVALVAATPVTLFAVSEGVYIVNVYANNGNNSIYQSTSLVIHDGTLATITALKAGGSNVLSLSGNNVQATCAGTTTGTYSCLKIA